MSHFTPLVVARRYSRKCSSRDQGSSPFFPGQTGINPKLPSTSSLDGSTTRTCKMSSLDGEDRASGRARGRLGVFDVVWQFSYQDIVPDSSHCAKHTSSLLVLLCLGTEAMMKCSREALSGSRPLQAQGRCAGPRSVLLRLRLVHVSMYKCVQSTGGEIMRTAILGSKLQESSSVSEREKRITPCSEGVHSHVATDTLLHHAEPYCLSETLLVELVRVGAIEYRWPRSFERVSERRIRRATGLVRTPLLLTDRVNRLVRIRVGQRFIERRDLRRATSVLLAPRSNHRVLDKRYTGLP